MTEHGVEVWQNRKCGIGKCRRGRCEEQKNVTECEKIYEKRTLKRMGESDR